MSKLISGREALFALANDRDVEYLDENLNEWVCMDMTHHFKRKFRLKPSTITINGFEVPTSFEPKEGDRFWFISSNWTDGYSFRDFSEKNHAHLTQFGAWQTEKEIKEVVAALRKALRGE